MAFTPANKTIISSENNVPSTNDHSPQPVACNDDNMAVMTTDGAHCCSKQKLHWHYMSQHNVSLVHHRHSNVVLFYYNFKTYSEV